MGRRILYTLAMVEAQQISDLRINKRTKQQPNYDSHRMLGQVKRNRERGRAGVGVGWGKGIRCSSRGPSLQELEDGHLHLQDHIPSQQPGRAGVLRSEAFAQRGSFSNSLCFELGMGLAPGSQSCLTELRLLPKVLPPSLAPSTPSTLPSWPRLPYPPFFHPSQALPLGTSPLPVSFSASTS